jgi:hypothetical protein
LVRERGGVGARSRDGRRRPADRGGGLEPVARVLETPEREVVHPLPEGLELRQLDATVPQHRRPARVVEEPVRSVDRPDRHRAGGLAESGRGSHRLGGGSEQRQVLGGSPVPPVRAARGVIDRVGRAVGGVEGGRDVPVPEMSTSGDGLVGGPVERPVDEPGVERRSRHDEGDADQRDTCDPPERPASLRRRPAAWRVRNRRSWSACCAALVHP